MRTNNPAVYDTRFFTQIYYSKDEKVKQRLAEERLRRKRHVSSVVIHELYNDSLANEGREVAKVKITFLKQAFEVIPVDDQIAQSSAELRHKYHLSMGDSMIAATALKLKAVCITDDKHIKQIKEIETTWL